MSCLVMSSRLMPPNPIQSNQVNAALNGTVMGGGSLMREFGRRVHYADCGSVFATQAPANGPAGCNKRRSANDVRTELMPDRIHPNAAGHAEWAKCLIPAIERTMQQ